MLKKEAMAIKVAKLVLPEVVKDNKDSNLKESVIAGLEKAYIAGYDLAVAECKADNSNAGFTMAEFLEDLDENHDHV